LGGGGKREREKGTRPIDRRTKTLQYPIGSAKAARGKVKGKEIEVVL